jgi:hypothetical protein
MPSSPLSTDLRLEPDPSCLAIESNRLSSMSTISFEDERLANWRLGYGGGGLQQNPKPGSLMNLQQ